MEPTVDCSTCNMNSVDEDGDFRCNWRYPKPVKVVEEGRCFHVLLSNETYERAVARGKELENENNI